MQAALLRTRLNHTSGIMESFTHSSSMTDSMTPSTLDEMVAMEMPYRQGQPRTSIAQRLTRHTGNHMATRTVHVKPHARLETSVHVRENLKKTIAGIPKDATTIVQHTLHTAYSHTSMVAAVERDGGLRSHSYGDPGCMSHRMLHCTHNGSCNMRWSPMPFFPTCFPIDTTGTNSCNDPSIYAEDTEISFTPNSLSTLQEQQQNPLLVSCKRYLVIEAAANEYRSKSARASSTFRRRFAIQSSLTYFCPTGVAPWILHPAGTANTRILT